MEFLGFTLDVIGKLLVGFTAIMVHHRFLLEHKVDEFVFKTMQRERFLGVIGIVLIILGYIFQVPGKL